MQGNIYVLIVLIFLFSRHLQRFWGASGDFWQAGWDRILDYSGENPLTFWVYGKLFTGLVDVLTLFTTYSRTSSSGMFIIRFQLTEQVLYYVQSCIVNFLYVIQFKSVSLYCCSAGTCITSRVQIVAKQSLTVEYCIALVMCVVMSGEDLHSCCINSRLL